MSAPDSLRLLIVRRDNIGDLVCTTPMFQSLREKFPNARICVLVNSYNEPVVRNNPYIDEIFVYTKAKHRHKGQALLGVYLAQARMIMRLRRERFHYAIVAGADALRRTLSTVRFIRPRHIIGFAEPGSREFVAIDLPIPRSTGSRLHEAEDTFRLLAPLGIEGRPPAMMISPDAGELAVARAQVEKLSAGQTGPLIGVHISTRKPANRWPDRKYVELIRRLHRENPQARFLLLWAPGETGNAKHPGDDASAAYIRHELAGVPLIVYPKGRLEQLIADLALCDTVITSDGGALHIAAALGKPIVCFYGTTDASRWYPWGVPHILLQPPSRNVADISVDEVFAACQRLESMPGSSFKAQTAV